MESPTAERAGRFSWSIPPRKAKDTAWDAIIVGAGHNGIACAAYLAKAGKKVLVLEARERVGGACTIEEVWPGVKLSPCAYLCGLLHPLVVDELELRERGFEWTPASNGLFVPFPDGSSIQLFDDDLMCEQEVKALAPGDVKGWRAMSALLARVRDALRPEGPDDIWIGDAPCSLIGRWQSSSAAMCRIPGCRWLISAKE
jgi:phytoene dehydrogenase-like protein